MMNIVNNVVEANKKGTDVLSAPFFLNVDVEIVFLDEPPRYARVDVLMLSEYDGFRHAFLLVGAVTTVATDEHVSIGENDSLELLESVVPHLCHSKPFCSGFYLLGIYYYSGFWCQ